MTPLLHFPHHPQIHGVPDVKEGRGHVRAELDLELPSRSEQFAEFREAQDLVGCPREGLDQSFVVYPI